MSTETEPTAAESTAVGTGVPSPGTFEWVRQARAFTERYLRVLARNRAVLFWTVGFPAGFYLLTIGMFVDTGAMPPDVAAATKAAVAVAFGVFGAIIVCLNTFAQHLVEDFEVDRYEQFRALPVSPTADLAGRMAAGIAFMLMAVLAVLAVGAAVGASYAVRSLASIPVVLAVLVGFGVLWMSVATAIALAVPDSRYASIIAVSIALVSYFVTGFNGTVTSMFGGDAALLNVLPNTLATRVTIYHLVDVGQWGRTSLSPPGPPAGAEPLLLLGGYGLVCAGGAVLLAVRFLYGREVLA